MRVRLIQCELKFPVNLGVDGVAFFWNWENKVLEVAHEPLSHDLDCTANTFVTTNNVPSL